METGGDLSVVNDGWNLPHLWMFMDIYGKKMWGKLVLTAFVCMVRTYGLKIWFETGQQGCGSTFTQQHRKIRRGSLSMPPTLGCSCVWLTYLVVYCHLLFLILLKSLPNMNMVVHPAQNSITDIAFFCREFRPYTFLLKINTFGAVSKGKFILLGKDCFNCLS